jgi:hypothetical protein
MRIRVYMRLRLWKTFGSTAKPTDQQGKEKKGETSKLLRGGMQAVLGFTGFCLLYCLTVARQTMRRGYKLSVSRRGWMKME